MKALPTLDRGVTFRSRLEADWAATLDSLDIAWDYEPEGYKLSDGAYYSPDFYLPASGAWLEVKGAHMERVSKVEQFAAELWAAWTEGGEQGRPPLVILGMSAKPFCDFKYDSPDWIGVRGVGMRNSVGLSRCSSCHRWAFVLIDPMRHEQYPCCETCGAGNPWSDVLDGYQAHFVRVPRPVGRGR